MGYVEKISKELYNYRPTLTKQPDFDEFWARTVAETKAVPLNPTLEELDYPSPYVKVYDITYNGFDKTPVHGWYMVPVFIQKDKYPCLIHYHGFNGNRGNPTDFLPWIMLGACVVSVDCRDQSGFTGNCANTSSGYAQNFSCKGVLNKEEYYYRAVYMDCLKAIDFACTQKEVDADRIVLEGASQGGALTTAVSALDPRPCMALPDIPSNSDLIRRVEGEHGSFSSVAAYLRQYPERTDKAFEVLSYFDTMNLADRIKCKTFASVSLKDNVCPAKCYFATYNRIQSEKAIEIYPFNGHDARPHFEKKLRYFKENI